MFRPTSPQRPLFGVEHGMDPEKRTRLERTWAHAYRSSALPLIDEDRFAKFFDPGNGRPNKSVRLVVSVLVLKEIFDLTDREALEQLEWNTAWQYALDLPPEDAHTCQKTLHNFRALLLGDDEGAGLFESTTARLISVAGLRTQRQRQDSTHIVSNIKLLTRLGLFVKTITRFLESLRDEHPRMATMYVSDETRERYLDRTGYFGDARGSDAPRRLDEAALDAHRLVTVFSGHKTVEAMESYQLVKRLYEEQCVAPTEGGAERIALEEKPSSSSLQSPSDPDATYGHKGKGYEAQLAETCVEENPFQVVTAVSINGANESDQQQAEKILDQVERTCGATPKTMHGDAGYGSGENIVAAKDRGTDLAAPIGTKASTKHLPILQFEFDEAGERVLRCPNGQVPVAHKTTSTGNMACFTFEQCRGCPVREKCPTKKRHGMRVLRFSRGDVAIARRRVEQETKEFKERHKIRSGIEATNSELKRSHGLAKLRVRRLPRVALVVRLKALAMNVKRYVAHMVNVVNGASTAPACAC